MVSLKLAFVNAQPIPLSPEDLYTAPMGGSEKALLHLAKELTLLGHSVTIICNLSQGKLSDTYSFSENGKIYSYKLLSLSEYEKIIKNKYYDILVYFRLLTPLAYGSPKCGASVYVTHDMPNNHIIENLTGGIWGIDKVLFISEFQKKEFIKALSSQIPEFEKIKL